MKSEPAASAVPYPLRVRGVVGVASSAGGLKALTQVLAALPRDFPAAVVVVQHISPRHQSHLAEILGRHTCLRVKEAEEGDRLQRGHAFVAPPDRHVVVNPDGTLSLSQTGRVHHVRPSADVLFASMALGCKERAVAVVLSGADDDGAAGARLIRAMGGTVIAQDEATSVYFAMPRAAIATGAVDHVLPPDQIAARLERLTGAGTKIVPQKAVADVRRRNGPGGQNGHGTGRAVPTGSV